VEVELVEVLRCPEQVGRGMVGCCALLASGDVPLHGVRLLQEDSLDGHYFMAGMAGGLPSFRRLSLRRHS